MITALYRWLNAQYYSWILRRTTLALMTARNEVEYLEECLDLGYYTDRSDLQTDLILARERMDFEQDRYYYIFGRVMAFNPLP